MRRSGDIARAARSARQGLVACWALVDERSGHVSYEAMSLAFMNCVQTASGVFHLHTLSLRPETMLHISFLPGLGPACCKCRKISEALQGVLYPHVRCTNFSERLAQRMKPDSDSLPRPFHIHKWQGQISEAKHCNERRHESREQVMNDV